MSPTPEMQSSAPVRVDESLLDVKGRNYYESSFVPPSERENATEIDPRDKGTPDDWVPRHPELVRLTGRHPFNVEPPVWRVVDHGFISPNELHYVRNHGAVPRIHEGDTHKVRFGGAMEKPMEMTVEFIKKTFKEITIPVTLVCAGNRRKEENMIKQGLGFSWGPAAVSNALWTGVWVKDILEYVGIKSFEEGGKHVCFVGADKLPNGYYGTSIRREVCMDPTADVLLAYKMNGEELSPDHGYPIRLIVPGYIGGRMIKWLTNIEVTDVESANHYHYFDNRVLPSQVDAEKALAEGWWYKPPYIINELNINSAVVYPRHGEVLSLKSSKDKYTISGYAYGGGGIALTRVEVTLDDGKVRACQGYDARIVASWAKYPLPFAFQIQSLPPFGVFPSSSLRLGHSCLTARNNYPPNFATTSHDLYFSDRKLDRTGTLTELLGPSCLLSRGMKVSVWKISRVPKRMFQNVPCRKRKPGGALSGVYAT